MAQFFYYNTGRVGFRVTLLATLVSLSACGGGGGYYGNTYSNNNSSSSSTNSSASSSTTAAVNTSAISLYDSNNISTNTITAAGVTAKVKVTDASGKALSGALVTFTGQGVVFGTTNSAVLTDANGIASISVKPKTATDTGSYQLSATATYNGNTSTNVVPFNFSLQAASIAFANMAAASTTLNSGASTIVTLKTQDATSKTNQNNITVNFTTSCGTFDNASVVSSNQGDVATTYKAIDANGNLCAGPQTITATGPNATTTQSVQVTIAAISANSVVYTTKNPVNLVIKNSGSAALGQIQFTAYANGVPAPNQSVNISLTKGPADLSFVTLGNRSPQTVVSDASGNVTVNLYPGNLPGPVQIQASLATNAGVYAFSSNVAVSTGRASQNHVSLSVSKNSLRTDIDGDSATITAIVADRNGNSVPDGTVISFVAAGGAIAPNCATTTTNGISSCSVNMVTSNPRPVSGRVQVLAYLEGDKDFTDVNGDNMYTAGVDTLTNNMGDAFLDVNESGVFAQGEYVYSRGATGSCGTPTYVPPNVAQPNIPNTCDTGLNAVLRQQLVFAFAHDTPTFAGFPQAVSASSGGFGFQLFGDTMQNIPMPSGTVVSVTIKDNTPNNNQSCSAQILSGNATIPAVMNLFKPSTFASASNTQTGTAYSVTFQGCATGDYVTVTTAVPNGATTNQTVVLQ